MSIPQIVADGPDRAVAPDGVLDGAKTLGWTGGAIPCAGYSTAFIEVTAMGGATSIQVNWGIVGTNPLQVQNTGTGTASPTITATGGYACAAAGNLSYVATGGTPTVNLILKR